MSYTHLLTHFFNDKKKWDLLVGKKGVFKVNIINAIINISKEEYKNHQIINLKLINSPIFLIKSFNPGYFDNDFFKDFTGLTFDAITGILEINIKDAGVKEVKEVKEKEKELGQAEPVQAEQEQAEPVQAEQEQAEQEQAALKLEQEQEALKLKQDQANQQQDQANQQQDQANQQQDQANQQQDQVDEDNYDSDGDAFEEDDETDKNNQEKADKEKAAAIKIQAIQRGKNDRSKVEKFKEEERKRQEEEIEKKIKAALEKAALEKAAKEKYKLIIERLQQLKITVDNVPTNQSDRNIIKILKETQNHSFWVDIINKNDKILNINEDLENKLLDYNNRFINIKNEFNNLDVKLDDTPDNLITEIQKSLDNLKKYLKDTKVLDITPKQKTKFDSIKENDAWLSNNFNNIGNTENITDIEVLKSKFEEMLIKWNGFLAARSCQIVFAASSKECDPDANTEKCWNDRLYGMLKDKWNEGTNNEWESIMKNSEANISDPFTSGGKIFKEMEKNKKATDKTNELLKITLDQAKENLESVIGYQLQTLCNSKKNCYQKLILGVSGASGTGKTYVAFDREENGQPNNLLQRIFKVIIKVIKKKQETHNNIRLDMKLDFCLLHAWTDIEEIKNFMYTQKENTEQKEENTEQKEENTERVYKEYGKVKHSNETLHEKILTANDKAQETNNNKILKDILGFIKKINKFRIKYDTECLAKDWLDKICKNSHEINYFNGFDTNHFIDEGNSGNENSSRDALIVRLVFKIKNSDEDEVKREFSIFLIDPPGSEKLYVDKKTKGVIRTSLFSKRFPTKKEEEWVNPKITAKGFSWTDYGIGMNETDPKTNYFDLTPLNFDQSFPWKHLIEKHHETYRLYKDDNDIIENFLEETRFINISLFVLKLYMLNGFEYEFKKNYNAWAVNNQKNTMQKDISDAIDKYNDEPANNATPPANNANPPAPQAPQAPGALAPPAPQAPGALAPPAPQAPGAKAPPAPSKYSNLILIPDYEMDSNEVNMKTELLTNRLEAKKYGRIDRDKDKYLRLSKVALLLLKGGETGREPHPPPHPTSRKQKNQTTKFKINTTRGGGKEMGGKQPSQRRRRVKKKNKDFITSSFSHSIFYNKDQVDDEKYQVGPGHWGLSFGATAKANAGTEEMKSLMTKYLQNTIKSFVDFTANISKITPWNFFQNNLTFINQLDKSGETKEGEEFIKKKIDCFFDIKEYPEVLTLDYLKPNSEIKKENLNIRLYLQRKKLNDGTLIKNYYLLLGKKDKNKVFVVKQWDNWLQDIQKKIKTTTSWLGPSFESRRNEKALSKNDEGWIKTWGDDTHPIDESKYNYMYNMMDKHTLDNIYPIGKKTNCGGAIPQEITPEKKNILKENKLIPVNPRLTYRHWDIGGNQPRKDAEVNIGDFTKWFKKNTVDIRKPVAGGQSDKDKEEEKKKEEEGTVYSKFFRSPLNFLASEDFKLLFDDNSNYLNMVKLLLLIGFPREGEFITKMLVYTLDVRFKENDVINSVNDRVNVLKKEILNLLFYHSSSLAKDHGKHNLKDDKDNDIFAQIRINIDLLKKDPKAWPYLPIGVRKGPISPKVKMMGLRPVLVPAEEARKRIAQKRTKAIFDQHEKEKQGGKRTRRKKKRGGKRTRKNNKKKVFKINIE